MAADTPTDFTDLPLQPTGSGVADIEIARLQTEIADEENADAAVGGGTVDEAITDDRAVPSDDVDAPTRTQA